MATTYEMGGAVSPRPTSKLMPIIVYVPKDDYHKIEEIANYDNRSMSYVGRGLLAAALTHYKGLPKRSGD